MGPGAIVDHVLWAEIANPEIFDSLNTEGSRDVRRKNFTIRWRRDVIDTPSTGCIMVDEYGLQYNVESTNEIVDDTRKRFLTITGITELPSMKLQWPFAKGPGNP